MRNKWIKRALALRESLGLSKADLDRAMSNGGKGTGFTDMLRKETSPSVDNFAKLARILGISLNELYYGEGSTPATLSIEGVVKGGEMWQALTKKEKKDVPLSFFDKDLAVVQVDTNEMQPVYRSGDVLAGTKAIGKNLDNLIGRDCIVETTTGEKYIKFLSRGQSANTFTLRSFNPAVDDVANVKVAWAAPIQMIIRGVD